MNTNQISWKYCECWILMPCMRKSPHTKAEQLWNSFLLSKVCKYPIFSHSWPALLLQYSSLCEQATANTWFVKIVLHKLKFQEKAFLKKYSLFSRPDCFWMQYLKSNFHDPNKYISKTAGGALALFMLRVVLTTSTNNVFSSSPKRKAG